MLMDLLDPFNYRHSLVCSLRSENEHRPNQRNKSDPSLPQLRRIAKHAGVSNFSATTCCFHVRHDPSSDVREIQTRIFSASRRLARKFTRPFSRSSGIKLELSQGPSSSPRFLVLYYIQSAIRCRFSRSRKAIANGIRLRRR